MINNHTKANTVSSFKTKKKTRISKPSDSPVKANLKEFTDERKRDIAIIP